MLCYISATTLPVSERFNFLFLKPDRWGCSKFEIEKQNQTQNPAALNFSKRREEDRESDAKLKVFFAMGLEDLG